MYGELIRAARSSRGMTQVELAEVSGLAQPNISAIENDRRIPSAETLHRLLESCGFALVARAGDQVLVVPSPDDPLAGVPSEPPAIGPDDSIARRVRALTAVLDASEAIVRGRRP